MRPTVSSGDPRFPIRRGPVRFAVGPPDGLSSNSWRFWVRQTGDVYLACRDNFNNVKVSLHASGKWHMGFTKEAVDKNPGLVAPGDNRAWDVWNEPPEVLPNVVKAFQLVFHTSELAVRPEQRSTSLWQGIMFIEPAPMTSNRVTVVTLFITRGDLDLRHESQPSFRIASLDLPEGRHAQLVAHYDPELDTRIALDDVRRVALAQTERAGVRVPFEGYLYFLGHQSDGTRFIVGARTHPAP